MTFDIHAYLDRCRELGRQIRSVLEREHVRPVMYVAVGKDRGLMRQHGRDETVLVRYRRLSSAYRFYDRIASHHDMRFPRRLGGWARRYAVDTFHFLPVARPIAECVEMIESGQGDQLFPPGTAPVPVEAEP